MSTPMKFNMKNKSRGNQAPPSTMTVIMQVGLIVLSFIWMLAVIKVFLLEGHHRINRSPDVSQVGRLSVAEPVAGTLFVRTDLELNPVLIKGDELMRNSFDRKLDDKKIELTEKAANLVAPTLSEWAFIRAAPDYKIAGNREHTAIKHQGGVIDTDTDTVGSDGVVLRQPWELPWPPVQPDGTISTLDGVEVMPVIGLKVPRFYMPAEGVDLNKVGSKVNGHDTIYLMIASYRDFQCRETITSAYRKSDHPERLYIGAVDQTVDGDIGCMDLEIPCSEDPTQMICIYKDQISIYHMDAEYATGPVTGEGEGKRECLKKTDGEKEGGG